MSSKIKSNKKYTHSSTFYRKLNKIKNDEKNRLAELSRELKCMKIKKNSVEVNQLSNINNAPERDQSILPQELEIDSVQKSVEIEKLDDLSQYFEEYSDVFTSDEDCCNDETNVEINLHDQIRTWAIENKETHTSINQILSIFNNNNLSSENGRVRLPNDSRTLLSTPRSINIETMGTGEYWYNGLEKSLREVYKNLHEPLTIELLFNIDGLPIFRGSPIEFWPILCAVHGNKNINPFTIAVYSGHGKPPLKPYLEPFVNELNKLLTNGIIINEFLLKIRIKCFVCDTPARNYILGEFLF